MTQAMKVNPPRWKYLLCLLCVNRQEKGCQNIIRYTFQSLENGGLFKTNIDWEMNIYESGSTDLSYLDFLQEYREKYPHVKIELKTNPFPLDGFTNTHRMFMDLSQMEQNRYDYVLWMDDDIVVCKKFMENMHGWMRTYGKKSLFTSLYVCYPSFPSKISPQVHWANIYNYYGSCCTIFKPQLAQYVIQHFFSKVGKPDSKFRRCMEHFFPQHTTILVPRVSLVQHMNMGSVNHANNKHYKGHRSHNFVGVNQDPKFYLMK